jgi:hypothetical protein
MSFAQDDDWPWDVEDGGDEEEPETEGDPNTDENADSWMDLPEEEDLAPEDELNDDFPFDLEEDSDEPTENEFGFEHPAEYAEDEFVDEFEQGDRASDFAPRTPDELSELDGGWPPRSTDRASLTKRLGISGGLVGVGVVGAVLMVSGIRANNAFVDEWKNLYGFDPTDPEAQAYWSKNIRPARIMISSGAAIAVLGVGGAGVTMFSLAEGGAPMIAFEGRW